MKQTQPLIEYYKSANLLVKVNGEADVKDVYLALLQAIQELE
jgi:adenylate kinase family enzyme